MKPGVVRVRRPDDWHLHLRDDAMLDAVLPYSAAHFGRAVVMPNLRQPVCDGAAADRYRQRIEQALRQHEQRSGRASGFQPLMTAYLTDGADAAALLGAFQAGKVVAAKLYPAHATTNAAHGVADVFAIMPLLEAMAQAGMPLLVHAESTDPAVDIFDREAVFLERVLAPLIDRLPELKVVVEHITTRDGVDFVLAAPANVGATLTPQHLLLNRNAMFQGGMRPHHYCLPVLKREIHRLALRKAAVSGNPKFFLGTDSAPHTSRSKESACGCAGMFNAPTALASYAQVFEEEGALDRLEGFASLHGAAFYGLPVNQDYLTLRKQPWPVARVAQELAVDGNDAVRIFRGGEILAWSVDTD